MSIELYTNKRLQYLQKKEYIIDKPNEGKAFIEIRRHQKATIHNRTQVYSKRHKYTTIKPIQVLKITRELDNSTKKRLQYLQKKGYSIDKRSKGKAFIEIRRH